MTTQQLSTLLEVLPEPSLICDGTGAVIARNRAAQESEWAEPIWPAANVEIQSLGEGWYLARRKASPNTAPETAAQATASAAYPADIDTLARGIVHEIRNPLSAILTGAKLVQDDPQVAEETAMLLGVIRKESLRINDILSAFSDYVKPSPARLDVLDMAQAARETIEELRRDGILVPSVTVEDNLESPLNAWADEAHFHKALVHILQNATAAAHYNAVLHLSSRREGDKIVVCIDDNGPGFSPESLRRAFQPFYSTKPQSIGLGLSLAQATIQASGGRVWIENLFAPPGDATTDDQAPDEPSRNGNSPHLHGARACIELPTAPIKA